MKNNIIITIIVAALVGAAGFFGGMQYQQSQASTMGSYAGAGGTRQGMAGGARNRGGFGGAVRGQIISQDANTITLKMLNTQNGSSKIINLSSATKIVKTSPGATTDLTVGTEVAVFGTTNSDGSVTAQNIQINPIMMQRGGTPNPSPTQ